MLEIITKVKNVEELKFVMETLTPEYATTNELTTILAEYYNYYRKNVSMPFLYKEITGDSESPHEPSMCCALSLDTFKLIISLLYFKSCKELQYFLDDNNGSCQKKLIWKRSERLGYGIDLIPSSLRYIDICSFLIVSVFTDEYCRNPQSLTKLVNIFQYGIAQTNFTFPEDELDTFERHLKGNFESSNNYEWMVLFDQTFVMYKKYKQEEKYYGLNFCELWNRNINKSKTTFEI